jgi:hypothetical protein
MLISSLRRSTRQPNATLLSFFSFVLFRRELCRGQVLRLSSCAVLEISSWVSPDQSPALLFSGKLVRTLQHLELQDFSSRALRSMAGADHPSIDPMRRSALTQIKNCGSGCNLADAAARFGNGGRFSPRSSFFSAVHVKSEASHRPKSLLGARDPAAYGPLKD